MVGHDGADEADIAGPGDMDQVRLKIAQGASYEWQMAKETDIEAEVFFKAEGNGAARQLKGGEVAFGQQARSPFACPYAEEGQLSATLLVG